MELDAHDQNNNVMKKRNQTNRNLISAETLLIFYAFVHLQIV